MKPAVCLRVIICLALSTGELMAQSSPRPAVTAGANYFGVIELGAKGIKPLVVQGPTTGPKGERILPHMAKKYEVKNKNPYDGAATVANVLAEVESIKAQMIKDYNMPPANIYVVESSGIPQAAKDLLLSKLPNGMDIFTMPADKESEFVFKGIVPPNHMSLNEVVVLDIGSGNSKGAYLTKNSAPFAFDTYNIPLGTGTFAKQIKNAQKNGDNFLAVAMAATADSLLPPLRSEVRNKPGMQNCTRLYLAGGLPYVMSTLLHPEQILKKDRQDSTGKKESDWMDLSASDINRFYQIATTDPTRLLKPDLSAIAAADRPKVEAEINKAAGIFNQDELAAGAILLKTFMDEMHGERKAKIAFSRAALYAWPQGFVMDKIENP